MTDKQCKTVIMALNAIMLQLLCITLMLAVILTKL